MSDGYSVCFNEWALDKDIKNELGLLLIISSLCAKGYCYATNTYFANLFNIPEQSVSRKIKVLEEKGYITIEYKKRGCEVIGRIIRLTKLLTDDYQKCESTINKNVKDNIINNNNININNKYIVDIVDYLNLKTNQNYKSTTPKTRTLIKSRLKEKFTIEDFKKVIDIKCEEWLNTDMEKYLRPETLFGTKFESYLNQKSKLPKWFDNEPQERKRTDEEQRQLEELIRGY